jgi:hypothetical protein
MNTIVEDASDLYKAELDPTGALLNITPMIHPLDQVDVPWIIRDYAVFLNKVAREAEKLMWREGNSPEHVECGNCMEIIVWKEG